MLKVHIHRVYFPAESCPYPNEAIWGFRHGYSLLVSLNIPLFIGCRSPWALGFHMLWARSNLAFSTNVITSVQHGWRMEIMLLLQQSQLPGFAVLPPFHHRVAPLPPSQRLGQNLITEFGREVNFLTSTCLQLNQAFFLETKWSPVAKQFIFTCSLNFSNRRILLP